MSWPSSKQSSKPATPANDSFANLLPTNNAKTATNTLSLQERQKQIQEAKQRQETERNRQYDATFGPANSSHWDVLSGGQSTPEPVSSTQLNTGSQRPMQSMSANDDLLFAFSAAAPIDRSGQFPPFSSSSGQSTSTYHANLARNQLPAPQSSTTTTTSTFLDDDDVFGLKSIPQKSVSARPVQLADQDGDDILGLLGRPVSAFETEGQTTRPAHEQDRSSPVTQSAHDRAVAELADMGFSTEMSAIALATTESGLDVQAAVGWLLNQAHTEAKQIRQERSRDRSQPNPSNLEDRPDRGHSKSSARLASREAHSATSMPAWMREGEARGGSREKDATQMASEIGSTIFKSANSLWRTSRKQVQKAMADFSQETDPNMPKWMRDTRAAKSSAQSNETGGSVHQATDEAMMLEAKTPPSKAARPHDLRQQPAPLLARQRMSGDDGRNGYPDRIASRSPAQQPPTLSTNGRPAARLTKQDLEETSGRSYISPARRKKAGLQSQVDLISSKTSPSANTERKAHIQSNNPFLHVDSLPKVSSSTITPSPPKPKVRSRPIPSVPPSALHSSASYRRDGSEAFKRGDYSAAHAAYSAALNPLPQSHPLTIIVLCNRALTSIKVGDPKAAVADADAALAVIGPSRGEGETIITEELDQAKSMKEFFRKAVMRKAEALESMEKWTDAHRVWKEAVQSGVGGAISIQGRERCEKAMSGNRSSINVAGARPQARKAAPIPSALSDLDTGGSRKDSEAVKRMQAANAAAEKADDEKFALTDQVDAKLVAWKGTKSDNLRALLGSLDKVLWDGAGWKKVNMGDLVMPNKVKIIYMKAIAKVHPDKISLSASTEQKMISAAVFATLNEAWDKFKADNNL